MSPLPSPLSTPTYAGDHGKSGRSENRSSGVRRIFTPSSWRVEDLRLHLTQQVAAPATRLARLARHPREWDVAAVHGVEQSVAHDIHAERDGAGQPVVRKMRV